MAARHPTQRALLDAGIELGDEIGLANVSVDRIVRRAGVAKGTFYVHFADRTAFMAALHERFVDQLVAAIAGACHDLPPGLDRLLRGTTAYLDACFGAHGVKAVLVELRAEPAVQIQTARRMRELAAVVEADLAGLDLPDPFATARLVLAMAQETALIELEVGRVEPAARRSLERLIEAIAGTGDR